MSRAMWVHSQTKRFQAISVFDALADLECVILRAADEYGKDLHGEISDVPCVVSRKSVDAVVGERFAGRIPPLDPLLRLVHRNLPVRPQLRCPLRIPLLVSSRKSTCSLHRDRHALLTRKERAECSATMLTLFFLSQMQSVTRQFRTLLEQMKTKAITHDKTCQIMGRAVTCVRELSGVRLWSVTTCVSSPYGIGLSHLGSTHAPPH